MIALVSIFETNISYVGFFLTTYCAHLAAVGGYLINVNGTSTKTWSTKKYYIWGVILRQLHLFSSDVDEYSN